MIPDVRARLRMCRSSGRLRHVIAHMKRLHHLAIGRSHGEAHAAIIPAALPPVRACVGDSIQILLDQSPFYAESGGQVGDHGFLRSLSNGHATALVSVSDVQKGAGGELVVHHGSVEEGQLHVQQQVRCS